MSDSREIVRPVSVADDNGKAKQFDKGAVPEGTSKAVLGRLERAGAFSDRPTTNSGGARTLENSGFNPVTATATADAASGEVGEYDARSVEETNVLGKASGLATGPETTTDKGDAENAPDFGKMTKAELVEYAEANGIDIDKSKGVDHIRAVLKAA